MVTLVGAGIWTIFIFYPYLRVMKEMQIEALLLGKESTQILKGLNDEIKPTIDKIIHSLDRAESLVDDFEKRDVFNRVENHLENIRANIEVRTQPLPVVRRPTGVGTNGEK